MLRPYLLLVAVLALVGSFIGGYLRGYHAGNNEEKVVALQQENSVLAAQLASTREALDTQWKQVLASDTALNEAANRADLIQADAEALQKKVSDYENQIRAAVDKHCALNRSDVQRLRDIAPAPRSVRHAPAAPTP